MSAILPDFQTGLPFDAFDRADRDILFRVRNGHAMRPRRMTKLMVTPFHGDEAPSCSLELSNDCPAVHAGADDVQQRAAGQAAAGSETHA
jgi:hypothetical protein